jgi:hypothetical protein
MIIKRLNLSKSHTESILTNFPIFPLPIGREQDSPLNSEALFEFVGREQRARLSHGVQQSIYNWHWCASGLYRGEEFERNGSIRENYSHAHLHVVFAHHPPR